MTRGARVSVIRACWPLSFVRTVFVCTALLAMCSINDKQLDPSHSVVFEAGCERKDSLTQQPIAALQTSMQMLAIATRFARMAHYAHGAPGRYVIVVLYSGVLAGMSSVGVAVTVCLVGYLLACGDVQPNPGPGQSSEDGTELQNGAADSLLQAHNNQTFFDSLHADMAYTMNQAVSRMETATQQQGKKIEERLGSVEDKIDRRLCEVETRQTQLANCMDSLHSECQAPRSDNQDLRGTVNYLTEKCDYMENQSRHNNLVFTGFASVREGFESWEDCERKVKACVKEGMGTTERLEIERAHRVGKAIVVRFLSYTQKMLVLTNERKLKTSNDYDNIYAREDFSETVQKKCQALMTLQRELRQKGHIAKLRFDKLITEDSMYTCDLFNDRIMRHNRREKQPTTNPDVPRHEERVRQSGRSWEGGGARNVHRGANPDPRPTAQTEHRPGPPQDSSDYLLQSSQFPPLRPVRNTSGRQPDQDPADSGHAGLATAQGSSRPGHEQQRDAVPAAWKKGTDTPHCTRRHSETGIETADRLTERRGQRDSIEATPDHQSSAVSAN